VPDRSVRRVVAASLWRIHGFAQNHEYAKAKLQQLGVPIDPAPSLQAWLREVFTGR
jgi:hypothetical protein